jgi:hypothetical protein
MADTGKAAFSQEHAALFLCKFQGCVMLDKYLSIYPRAGRPLLAIAHRWVCRGLHA